MPALTPDDRRKLLGPVGHCPTCRAPKIRHYCRSCDEFYTTCLCAPLRAAARKELRWTPHDDHRVYIWTPTGIEAIPDFDGEVP